MAFRTRLILVLVIFNAALLRFWGLDFGLPNLQCRPDETGVVIKTLAFFGGDLNPHFFRYPTLFFYFLASVFAVYMLFRVLLGATTVELLLEIALDPSVFVLMARGVSASVGTLTVLAVFFVARRFFCTRVGLVAAFLMSVCYLHVRESHFGLTDVAMTFFIVCVMGAVWLVWQRGHRWDYIGAGFLTGMSVSTKYAGAFLVVPVFIAHVHVLMQTHGRRLKNVFWDAIRSRNMYRYGLFVGIGFLMFTPFSVLDFSTFWHDVMAESLHLNEGHAGLTVGRGWWYHALYSLPGGVGWPMLGGAVFGFLVLWRRDVWQAVVLGAFPVVFYCVAGKGQTVFVRYMVPVLPFVCIFCAVGIDAVIARFQLRHASWVWVVLCILVAGPSIYRSVYLDHLLAMDDSRVIAARWVENEVAGGNTIYQSGTDWAHTQLVPSLATLEKRLQTQQQAGRKGRLLQIQMDHVRAGGRDHKGYDIVAYNPNDPIWENENLPDYVILYESPLKVYTPLPGALTHWVDGHYQMVKEIAGVGDGSRSWFDQLDAFFVPYTGLAQAKRLGPNIRIYALDSAK